MNTVKPLLIFAIVMKDRKKDGFSFVQFHVTDSRLIHFYIHMYVLNISFYPFPNYFDFPTSSSLEREQASENEEPQSRYHICMYLI